MNKRIFWILILLFHFTISNSQSDTTIVDKNIEIDENTLLEKKSNKKKRGRIKRFFKEGYPSPRKAVILTAILPGLGQIYNKKYWYIKLPIVYGAFAGLAYSIDFNRGEYLRLKKEYRYMVDGLECTVSVLEGRVSADVVKNARDRHDKWLQMTYIGIGLAYILTAAEAYTTAHLLSFDVSDDLSLQFKPTLDFIPTEGAFAGIGVNFQLGKKKTKIPKNSFMVIPTD